MKAGAGQHVISNLTLKRVIGAQISNGTSYRLKIVSCDGVGEITVNLGYKTGAALKFWQKCRQQKQSKTQVAQSKTWENNTDQQDM